MNRRLSAEGAACHTGERALVSSYGPHFGEENPLVGSGGSGTIFFTWCNLRCQFCQNYDISQGGAGHEVEPEELAKMMLSLQSQGCHKRQSRSKEKNARQTQGARSQKGRFRGGVT